MDYMQITSFTLIALLLVVSPGPNGLLIAKTVASSGIALYGISIWNMLRVYYLQKTKHKTL